MQLLTAETTNRLLQMEVQCSSVETSMDLSNRGVKSDRGFNRALYGMRALIEEVNVINEEEEVENNKNNRSEDNGDEHKHEADGAALTVDEAILPPPVSNTKGRKKESKSDE